MTDKVAGPDGSALSEGLGALVEREFVRAKTIAYGPNNADDETREGDFGTWGDWRQLVLRVADAAVAAEREHWMRCSALMLVARSGQITDPALAERLISMVDEKRA